MKKLAMICLTILMFASLGVSAFATTGGFVSSPSGNQAPELIKGENKSEDCVAELTITAYVNRDQLSEDSRKKIEQAYSEIMGATDLDSLNAKIDEIAEERGVDSEYFAVSDLFDISESNCENHEGHSEFDVVLSAETLNNFVCLLHYYNGEWTVVENAKVTNNGEHLQFSVDEFSPFAIVVSNAEAPDQPAANNNIATAIAIVADVIVIAGIIVLIILMLKKRA